MSRIRRAVISVTDKTGVVDFARALAAMGVEILSTGGTAKTLREAGLKVRDVSDFTGFPEMLDGRIKTLHPRVHAGVLYMRGHPGHEAAMAKHNLEPVDLVCVNLYAFEATVAKPGVTLEEAIENIDIGGPTMIRAAAKNMKHVTVITEPDDYARVLECMRANGGDTTAALRFELGRKVYARMAAYDGAIAAWLAEHTPEGIEKVTPPFVLSRAGGERLRYGENPHQSAVFYRDPVASEACIAHTRQLHGKEMSYNNYLDGDAALETVKELAGVPAVCIIKHSNPCGIATGATLAEAFEAAWAGDPVSAFGSVIAVTEKVDAAMAALLKGRFVEALIAPAFDDDALEMLRKKSKDLRLLVTDRPLAPAQGGLAFRQINGGVLVQDRDTGACAKWETPTRAEFPAAKRALAEFGVKVCKHVKSNAIVIVREYAPGRYAQLGMGCGQPNRVDSVGKLAVVRAKENLATLHEREGGTLTVDEFIQARMAEAVLVSDAFFPFPDNIQQAAAAGLRFIVEPGGSVRDAEVIEECDRQGVAMALTGMRHFMH